jgi:hypothetical protein
MDMKRTRQGLFVIAAALVFFVSLARGEERPDPPSFVEKTADWPAPPYWSPLARPDAAHGPERGLRREQAEALPTSPMPFIGITPCRLIDTRQAGFPAGYGVPSLAANVPRNFDLNSDPRCPGIAGNAQAYSLSVAVTNTQGLGFILIFPQGSAQPLVSTLNYVAGQTVANAAIVPAGDGGGVTVVAGVSGTDLIIDINGYYAPAGLGEFNTFLGLNAGNSTMTGEANTGIGHNALFRNTTGLANTAVGDAALGFNTEGNANTAIGEAALSGNTMGSANTATGIFALRLNTTGDDNTATGREALRQNDTGFFNTATGSLALANNTTGTFNTAAGRLALFGNETGEGNTAVGGNALGNTTGSGNIGIGLDACVNTTTGSTNICIGSPGVAGESTTIRIGTIGIQTATFVAGISGTTSPGGVGVFINGNGQLGTATSSRRFKEDIREIGEESDGLMRLRPVAFRYKPEIDPTGLTQYGLIAEEVAAVYPDLVVYDRDGWPETVRYHLINAMLLNEVQKQHRIAELQSKTIEQQQAEIEELKARLSKLEAGSLANSRP